MGSEFDLYAWIDQMTYRPALSGEEVADEAAWLWLTREDWVPTPELFFAMREVIREQMMGG